VNTFNKVWILPDDALIYEKGNTAYVLKNHLKVMLEEDYLALEKNSVIPAKAGIHNKNNSVLDSRFRGNDKGMDVNQIGSKIVREIVLPALEIEVNKGKNFAALRQVYSGMLLAAWYKRALKESLLAKIYANQSKLKGIDSDPQANQAIYQQYLKAYKKGVFNFIKEDVDKYSKELIPRKYFSGGTGNYHSAMKTLGTDVLHRTSTIDPAQRAEIRANAQVTDLASVVAEEVQVGTDAAMNALQENIRAELIEATNSYKKNDFGPVKAVLIKYRESIKTYPPNEEMWDLFESLRADYLSKLSRIARGLYPGIRPSIEEARSILEEMMGYPYGQTAEAELHFEDVRKAYLRRLSNEVLEAARLSGNYEPVRSLLDEMARYPYGRDEDVDAIFRKLVLEYHLLSGAVYVSKSGSNSSYQQQSITASPATDEDYKLFGLARGAMQEDIKRAHRRLVKMYYESVNPSAEAQETMKAINSAYERLGSVRDGAMQAKANDGVQDAAMTGEKPKFVAESDLEKAQLIAAMDRTITWDDAFSANEGYQSNMISRATGQYDRPVLDVLRIDREMRKDNTWDREAKPVGVIKMKSGQETLQDNTRFKFYIDQLAAWVVERFKNSPQSESLYYDDAEKNRRSLIGLLEREVESFPARVALAKQLTIVLKTSSKSWEPLNKSAYIVRRDAAMTTAEVLTGAGFEAKDNTYTKKAFNGQEYVVTLDHRGVVEKFTHRGRENKEIQKRYQLGKNPTVTAYDNEYGNFTFQDDEWSYTTNNNLGITGRTLVISNETEVPLTNEQRKGTNQQWKRLAEPLFYVANLIGQTSLFEGRERDYFSVIHFIYHGAKYIAKYKFFLGDENPVYSDDPKITLSEITVKNIDNGKEIKFSGMAPYHIVRHGDFTNRGEDLKPLSKEEIEEVFTDKAMIDLNPDGMKLHITHDPQSLSAFTGRLFGVSIYTFSSKAFAAKLKAILEKKGDQDIPIQLSYPDRQEDRALVANPKQINFKNAAEPLGGIDFNAAHLNLQIKRDGQGVPLPMSQQNLESIKLEGLIPVILEIKPVLQTPLLTQLQVANEPELAKI
jgi:hypothetical protein